MVKKMIQSLPSSWCVINDGTLLFRNTVIKYMNRKKEKGFVYLTGEQNGCYYGERDGAQFCVTEKPKDAVLISLAKFCKATGAITDIVKAVVNSHIDFSPSKKFTMAEVIDECHQMYGATLNGPQARQHLHTLRCSGEIKNLIASPGGYYLARSSKEVRKYLDELQERAMRIHELQAAIKDQAEDFFGKQMEIPMK